MLVLGPSRSMGEWPLQELRHHIADDPTAGFRKDLRLIYVYIQKAVLQAEHRNKIPSIRFLVPFGSQSSHQDA